MSELAYYVNRTKKLERELKYLKYIIKKQDQEIKELQLLLSKKIEFKIKLGGKK